MNEEKFGWYSRGKTMKGIVGCVALCSVLGEAAAVSVRELNARAFVLQDKHRSLQGLLDAEDYAKCMQASGLEASLPCFEEVGKAGDDIFFAANAFKPFIALFDLAEPNREICNIFATNAAFQCFQQPTILEPFIKFHGDFLLNRLDDNCPDSVKDVAKRLFTETEEDGKGQEISDSVAAVDEPFVQIIKEFGDKCEKIAPGITIDAIPIFTNATDGSGGDDGDDGGDDDSAAVLSTVSVISVLLALAQVK